MWVCGCGCVGEREGECVRICVCVCVWVPMGPGDGLLMGRMSCCCLFLLVGPWVQMTTFFGGNNRDKYCFFSTSGAVQW